MKECYWCDQKANSEVIIDIEIRVNDMLRNERKVLLACADCAAKVLMSERVRELHGELGE